MKSVIILILSLMNVSFAKTINASENKKSSFTAEILEKIPTTETDAISSQECKGGGGGDR